MGDLFISLRFLLFYINRSLFYKLLQQLSTQPTHKIRIKKGNITNHNELCLQRQQIFAVEIHSEQIIAHLARYNKTASLPLRHYQNLVSAF